jgi:hypothetical protein
VTTTQGQTTKILEGVHGQRYGEMLLVKQLESGLVAEVYNSFTLNDCPEALWRTLDPAAIAQGEGALIAVPNGPRYWLMDVIEKISPGVPNIHEFGGIAMNRAAVLDLSGGVDPTPYLERRVARTAVFTFAARRTVYELSAPNGSRYVMQSWCTAIDESLAEADLPSLATRLSLPEGWTYSSRELTMPLAINTSTEDAVVIQDDLRNSYSLES